MKTAMFVLGIIELSFLFIALCLHSVEKEINDWTGFDSFVEVAVVSILVWIGFALSVLSIIAKFV